MKRAALLALSLAGAPAPVWAQTAPVEAPADEALPDLNVPAKDLGDARKYVVFHKPGATVEQVTADLSFCWRFVPHGVPRGPGFIPWRQRDATRPVAYDGGSFGLVGYAIASIIAGPLERSIRQTRMFRCMLPRGYDRYRTSEAVWSTLNGGDAARSIRLQARIAAGPVPPTEKVTL